MVLLMCMPSMLEHGNVAITLHVALSNWVMKIKLLAMNCMMLVVIIEAKGIPDNGMRMSNSTDR